MHADRTNRALLTVLGLVLATAGLAALLASVGVFGDDVAGRSLPDNPVSDYIGRNDDWFWPALALLALVLIVLVLWWLSRIIFSTSRVGHIELPARAPGERTTLATGALTRAVTKEIEGYHGVGSAHVTVVGTAEDPALAVTVDADRGADLAALRHRIETGALAKARWALANPDLPATVDLTLGRADGARIAR